MIKFILNLFIIILIISINNKINTQILNNVNDLYKPKLNNAANNFKNDEVFNSILKLKDINEYSNNFQEYFSFKDINDDLEKEYLNIIQGLILYKLDFKLKALNFILNNDITNKKYKDKITFFLIRFNFYYKDYKVCIDLSNKLTFENITNKEVLTLKFILAYSNFENKNFEKSFVLFDAIRQLEKNNIYLADANYYYAFLLIKLNNNLISALNSFKKIEYDKFYYKIIPYYISNILYLLNLKDFDLKYLEKKLKNIDSKEYLFYNEMNYLLTELYVENGKYNLAIKQLNYIKEKTQLENYYLGTCYYLINRYDSSIRILSNIKNVSSEILNDINYILGQSYLSLNNNQKATQYFYYYLNSGLKLIYEEHVLFIYSKLLLFEGNNNVALKSLENFIQKFPNSKYIDEVNNYLITLYSNTNDFKSAINFLKFNKNINYEIKSRIYYGRALDFYFENNIDSSKYFLEQNIQLEIKDSFYYFSLSLIGEIYYIEKKYQLAIKYLNLLNKLNVNNLSNNLKKQYYFSFYNLAYCYLKLNEIKSAFVLFDKIQKNGENILQDIYFQDVILRLADCYFMLKQYKNAKETYLNYLKNNNLEKFYAKYQLAIIEGINKPEDKINLLNKLVNESLKSNIYFLALKEIGNTQMSLNQFENCIKTFNKIINTNDINNTLIPYAILNIGLANQNLDRIQDALNNFEKILFQYPNSNESNDVLPLIKNIYTNKGDITGYFDLLKKIGKNLPNENSDSLYFEAAELKYREKNYNESLNLFNNYLKLYLTNNERKINALYYVLHIHFFNKNYDLMYQIGDSIINFGDSRFLEKSLILMTKIKDNNFEDKRLLVLKELYKSTKTNEIKQNTLIEILNNLYNKKKWNEGYEYALLLKNDPRIPEYQKVIYMPFITQKYIKDSLYENAIIENEKIISLNKNSIGAYASYQNSILLILLNKLDFAEKQAFNTINEFINFDFVVVPSYLLLGNIYLIQNDFFNANATFKSIANTSKSQEFTQIANMKIKYIEDLERKIQIFDINIIKNEMLNLLK